MRCFRCAKEIIVPYEGDPIWQTQTDRVHYFPATVMEVLRDGDDHCRCAVVCWGCFHAIDPDMWLGAENWDADATAIKYEQLPVFDHEADDRDEIEKYAAYAPTEGP